MLTNLFTSIRNSLSQKEWLILLAVLIVYNCCISWTFDYKVDLGGDNLGYYIYGKAIAGGEGYTNVHTINQNPANWFPPAYPYILGALFILTGESVIAAKALNSIFLALSLILVFFIGKRLKLRLDVILVSILLLCFNSNLLHYASIMMSEIPFTLISLLSLLVLLKIDNHKPVLKDPYVYLLGLLTAMAYLMRSIGMAVLVAAVIFLLFEKQFRKLFISLIVFALAILPEYLRTASLDGGKSYIDFVFLKNPYRPEEGTIAISDLFSRLFENIWRYIAYEIPAASYPFMPEYDINYKVFNPVLLLVGIIIISSFSYGLYKLDSRWRKALIAYFIAYFGVLLLWPSSFYGVRFILPLVPFIVIIAVSGLFQVLNFIASRKLQLKSGNAVSIFMSLSVISLFTGFQELHEKKDEMFPDRYQSYIHTALFAKEKLPEDAVVMCRKPFIFHFFSERFVSGIPNISNPNLFLLKMKEKKVDYAVVDALGFSSTVRYLAPNIKKNKEKFELTYKTQVEPPTYLFKMKKQGELE